MTFETTKFMGTAHRGAGANTSRSFFATSAAAAFGLVLLAGPSYAQSVAAGGVISPHPAKLDAPIGDSAIRSFRVNVPEAALVDLRNRIAATRWPDRETVTDQSQRVRLATMKELVRYWGTDYDWRKVEGKLNALPMFLATIDGIDIQFIHVRSRHPNALPPIVTYGWPGSILELVKVIGPLIDPTAHGGRAEDAFDVVIPSMPGYGFSRERDQS